MLLGSSTMAVMNVIAKFIKKETDASVFELCYFRALIMAIGCFMHAKYAKVNVIDVP